MKDDVRVVIDRAGKLVAELGILAYLIDKGSQVGDINDQFCKVLSHIGFVNGGLTVINREIGRQLDELREKEAAR